MQYVPFDFSILTEKRVPARWLAQECRVAETTIWRWRKQSMVPLGYDTALRHAVDAYKPRPAVYRPARIGARAAKLRLPFPYISELDARGVSLSWLSFRLVLSRTAIRRWLQDGTVPEKWYGPLVDGIMFRSVQNKYVPPFDDQNWTDDWGQPLLEKMPADAQAAFLRGDYNKGE